MLKNKDAQGMPINVIIFAIIGLIILVVLISIFTGRLNIYSSGVDELTTCENTCKNIGYDSSVASSDFDCVKHVKGSPVPGSYSDVTGEDADGRKRICCCYNLG